MIEVLTCDMCLSYVCLSYAGTVFSNSNQQTNVYGDDVEVDYRGYEVLGSVANW